MTKIDFEKIEKRCREYGQSINLNKTRTDFKNGEKKFYILDMFPYPSGEGLHVGHPKGYIATDIYSRYQKMNGYNVLHPMGFDAFGLPAEQYAIKHKLNPRVATERNIARYKEQLDMLGLDYDGEREVITTDPKFYKGTQWMFKQMYKDGLAYESDEPINGCPSCKTGLANEDLDGNVCERCGSVVEKRKIRQWVIRITDYADRLLKDLDKLNGEPHIKELQRNWIGKSEGSEIDFQIVDVEKNNLNIDKLKIFTTRADTLYGATFMAVSYTLAKDWIQNGWKVSEKINNFIEKLEKEEKNRTIEFDMSKLEKEGIDTGIKAINPANNEEIPIYIANYILSDYGTGAIMAVPAHDERDYEFAKKYDLEIRKVILGEKDEEEEFFSGNGILINSNEFDGMNSEEAKIKITEKIDGKMVSQYKLKDGVFARQRYGGEPFPIVFDDKHNSYAVADKDLPVILPEVENYEPGDDGLSPLAKIKDGVEVYGFINEDNEFESSEKDNPKAKKFFRETNTMPQGAGSSGYYLRYIDPENEKAFVDKALEKKGDPVDFYVGGAEHATRHLIYARFWHKYLFDKGLVNYDEPFSKLQTVGLIMAEDGRKMSKRYGNVVNPDEVVKEYGADTMRTYEMFMGPFEKATSWSTKNILGVYRFLERVYNISLKLKDNFGKNNSEVDKVINESIQKVSIDILEFKFNTAIAQLMICLNTFEDNFKNGENNISKESFEDFLKILSPIAIFITEEIWQSVLGNNNSIHQEAWPKFDEAKIIESEINLSIQINGKFRGVVKVKVDLAKDEIMSEIKNTEIFQKYVESEAKIKNIILVKNRLINIIV